ncbi:MAG: hypothetical protein Q4C00_01270 [Bacillota bacterium]|nr:hypothetical protein [Bacillota bacterium]
MRLLERFFLCTLMVVFILLIAVQLYFFIFPDTIEEARAERLGGSIENTASSAKAVENREEGLFLFLTFEAKSGYSAASILINGEIAGDLKLGVLSLKVNQGETVSVVGGSRGDVISLMDRPEHLDPSFPNSLSVGGEEKKWGIVRLK